jgi:hypothetical protein
MIRAMLFVAVGALASGCAAQPGIVASDAPPPAEMAAAQSDAAKITFKVTSWGYVMEEWSIDSAGRASLVQRAPGVSLLEPIAPTTYSASPADFERVRAALAPAERFAGRHFSCDNAVTDAPSGSVTWATEEDDEKTVGWYMGCLQPDAESDFLFQRTNEAYAIFHQVIGAR